MSHRWGGGSRRAAAMASVISRKLAHRSRRSRTRLAERPPGPAGRGRMRRPGGRWTTRSRQTRCSGPPRSSGPWPPGGDLHTVGMEAGAGAGAVDHGVAQDHGPQARDAADITARLTAHAGFSGADCHDRPPRCRPRRNPAAQDGRPQPSHRSQRRLALTGRLGPASLPFC
jgi:hypothetical protein